MDIFKEILNMKGPLFLCVYAGAVFACFILYRFASSYMDGSSKMQRLKLPLDLDPYLVAYIKGGAKNIIPSVIGVLLHKEAVELKGDKVLKSKTTENVNPGLESKVLNSIHNLGSKRVDLMSSKTANEVQLLCDKYEKFCYDKLLTRSAISLIFLSFLKVISILSLLVLGGAKLVYALNTGHSNVGFLILEMVVMVILIGNFCKTGKLTKRGKKFIEDISKTNESLKEKSSIILSPEMCAMGIALYGSSFLIISPISELREVFNFQSPGNSFFGGSGGSSCSGCSSCSSCSSCGGCGGCGGG